MDGLCSSNLDDKDAVETSSILAGGLDHLGFGGLSRQMGRECEEKRAPGAGFGFHPDASGVQLDNLFHDRKTDARACGFLPQRQRLEYPENLFKVLLVDSGAVIGNAELPGVALTNTTDLDLSIALGPVLYGIAQKIVKNLYYV